MITLILIVPREVANSHGARKGGGVKAAPASPLSPLPLVISPPVPIPVSTLPLARIRIKTRHTAYDWQSKGRCRVMASQLPTDDYEARNALSNLFYPTRHQGPKEVQAAKEVCRLCPVKADCLVSGTHDWEKVGIWGGETEQERRITRRKMRKAGVRKSDSREKAVEWALGHLYPTTPEEKD